MTVIINGTNGIVGVSGSAASPAITVDADTNTGIFFPEADNIGIVTGGTERMRINNDGIALNGSTSGSITLAATAVAGDNTLTLPAVTDTLVGLAATQTLTNKTIQGGTIQGGTITSDTAQLSTSGTSIDFTSIPSWVKRITVMFSGVSTNGTNPILVQIGSGSFSTSGYLGAVSENRATTDTINFTFGFGVAPSPIITEFVHGIMTIVNITGTTWVASFVGGKSDVPNSYSGGGSSGSIGGSLDRLRILASASGSPYDTFDAGTINIMYE